MSRYEVMHLEDVKLFTGPSEYAFSRSDQIRFVLCGQPATDQ